MRKNSYRLFHLLSLAVIMAVLMPGGLAKPTPVLGEIAKASPVLQEEALYPVYLRVVSARTEPKADVVKGDLIPTYKFLLNIDNTGDPFNEEGCDRDLNPLYPEGCDLPGIRSVPAWSPIYTQGSQEDFSEATALSLPPGKYLVSVTADGFKLDGQHFTVPAGATGPITVEVGMQPFPLPPASMVIQVFEDNALTNGAFDVPAEHGLAGFRASINDIAGEITTDIFGKPLCTIYEKDEFGDVLLDADGNPVVLTLGRGCYSDADGLINIPNIGPLRYDVLVFPPSGQQWIQTTTLEGSHGWDTWLQEAGTGLDNEFLVAAEPAPWTIFGFVQPNTPDLGGTGSISGVIMGAATYVPASGGLPYIGDTFGGFSGTKLHRPIKYPWLSLNSLTTGDAAIWVGQGYADGSFTIPNVPAGDYFLAYWDFDQHYILDFVQVTVQDGQAANTDIRMLTNWFTEVYGTVFHDINENGKRDSGEAAIPNYLIVLKDRDNTEIDRMSIASMTDVNGFYELPKGYPMGSWMILEAYSDLFHTTGVTYQTLNMKEEETILGPIVDIGLLPVLGQPVRLDWGVHFYDEVLPNGQLENGGIAGTVFYDTVRAEDDARYAGVEPWQPGIPGLTVNLYEAEVDEYGKLSLDPDGGAALKKRLVASTVTETYARPKGCTALDVYGDPVDLPVLPFQENVEADCLEGPLMGTQIGSGQNELDGNWGFSEGCMGEFIDLNTGLTVLDYYDPGLEGCASGNAPIPLPSQMNYLVEVAPINDALGNEMLQVTREEDLNVFDGDEYFPMMLPPACAGPLHIVDVMGAGEDWYDGFTNSDGIWVPPSTPVDNPGFADAYTPRYEGTVKPLCNVKHVFLPSGKAVAPIFNFFTEVPIPGKWRGYIIDNLNVSVDPNTLFYGEMAGVPNVPIGLYDFSGRLVHTVHSDRDGVYEVLMPSTGTFNAPSPSGMFANVYYQYGNDPGPIGKPNEHYNPQYRSIGTSFEVYPGVTIPADLAPTQSGAAVWSPGSQYNRLAICKLEDTQPQLFVVDQPYGAAGDTFTITGLGFGEAPGKVTLGDTQLAVDSWSDTQIVVTIPAGIPAGPLQLLITAVNGLSTVNGLTFHLLGEGYNPAILEVGTGKQFDPAAYAWDATNPDLPTYTGPIQAAIDYAYENTLQAVVVVYPGNPVEFVNTQGVYLENPVIYFPIKLQGVGPGGILPDGTGVSGAIIDGRGVGGDTPYSLWWRENLLPEIWNIRGGWDRGLLDAEGNPQLNEGSVITVFGNVNEFGSDFQAAVDGFIIQGGDQQGFPNAVLTPTGVPEAINPLTVVQGGAIFLDGYASEFQITNNHIQSNGGTYGVVRLGWAHIEEPLADNHNDNVRIAHNRILANGGVNLAGAIGLFNGADSYEIAYNDICGNSSVEYGGGISHYGWSPDGSIHHNRIYYNSSYDEGGGVMIAGELPAVPGELSVGAGPVDIFNNLIQHNLANDDGGGLRFLMAGDSQYNVYNNIIANNVSTHEGGGISLNDAPYVSIIHNTIVKNITTATAMTSNGSAAPAGLSTSRNSVMLQGTLPLDYPLFSNPVLERNLFWDNRAGAWSGTAIYGLGLEGDPSAIYNWDLGVAGDIGLLNPVYNLLQVEYAGGSNNVVGMDPLLQSMVDTRIRILPWRTNINFVGINLVAMDLPVTLMGDYHLSAGSPAIDAIIGLPSTQVTDFDGDARPQGCGPDMGADEAVMPDPLVYLSGTRTTDLPGVNLPFDDADIYAWDGSNFWCVFDASQAGVPSNARLGGISVNGPQDFLLTFTSSFVPTGSTLTVRSEDIVRYQNGTWSMFFDASDVGMNDELVDALAILPDGSLVLSWEGNAKVPNPVGNISGEDLVRCTGTFGEDTVCTWSWFFDGSDVGLKGVDVDGLHTNNSTIYLSTLTNYSVTGLSGGPDDIFACQGATTGETTACTGFGLVFDGSSHGFTNITAFHVPENSVLVGLAQILSTYIYQSFIPFINR